jgi:S-disulfanyl-L-cysteine oxidoreductase SoxD
MSTLKATLALVTALGLGAGIAHAQTPAAPNLKPGLGKSITEADIAAWDVAVMPDGTGLPAGSGNAAAGAKVYQSKCSACHGDNGKGGTAPGAGPLAGGAPLTSGIDTAKTIGNFWGHSTTVFDFIRRAMPFNQPRTLSNDEVYALTAYLLSINKIIGETDVMNAQTLPKVRMPNRDNFIIRFPDRI